MWNPEPPTSVRRVVRGSGMRKVPPVSTAGRPRREAVMEGPAKTCGSQPEVDGEPIPEMSPWSYRTLVALNKIRSEQVRRSIGALIEEMAGSQ